MTKIEEMTPLKENKNWVKAALEALKKGAK